jgi:hypothetical protein
MERSAIRDTFPAFAIQDFASLHPGYEFFSPPHTFSNGRLIALRRSSHAGTGRFFERMKSGLNSFD